MVKTCTKCHETKDYSGFHKQPTCKDGYNTHCKVCYNTATRNAKILQRYGITAKEADKLKTKGCELCGSTHQLHIDHNHLTGDVRGVLCTNCNRGIGHLMDSPDLLRKAAQYLEERGNYSKWQI